MGDYFFEKEIIPWILMDHPFQERVGCMENDFENTAVIPFYPTSPCLRQKQAPARAGFFRALELQTRRTWGG
ncbi:MAG: hypothetical protein DSZ33_06670 [Gammaproteobacteria bacterium]|nr:MAG: hypothetical protein DSZ33_06670 [Gammaproteobacteria bacterium]